MKKQRQIDKNLGSDTHTRDHSFNKFQAQNHETYGMQVGEVLFPEPEPLFRQNMVTVKLARGGEVTSVAYPGAFIDPITNNLHGTYEGPIPGQMVTVGFENGNAASPFVVNRYPYQGTGNTFTESKFINPLTTAGFDSTDVMIGHFSGSFLSFNTGLLSGKLPGSVSLNAMTDLDIVSNTNITADAGVNMSLSSALAMNIESGTTIGIDAGTDMSLNSTLAMNLESGTTAEMKSKVTTLTGSTHVALNGNTNFAVLYTELKTAFDLFRTEVNTFITTAFNLHTHLYAPGPLPPAPSAVPIPVGVSATADMSAAQNTKVLM